MNQTLSRVCVGDSAVSGSRAAYEAETFGAAFVISITNVTFPAKELSGDRFYKWVSIMIKV